MEGFRERILQAKKQKKERDASAVVIKKEEPKDPIDKIRELKELLELDVLNEVEYKEIRARIIRKSTPLTTRYYKDR